jgi:hypothetical protein
MNLHLDFIEPYPNYMPYNPNIHHRRSIRLKGYDYSQEGLYFVTICCQNRQCLFGKIVDGKMILNDAGKIAKDCWQEIPNHFPNAILHEYVVMPNHIHGIVQLVGANQNSPNDVDVHDVGANKYSPNQNSPDNGDNDDMIGAKIFSPLRCSPSKTIGSIVRGYKIGVTKWMRQNTNVYDVWQRNYYEHIIRNERAFKYITEYIVNNPNRWNEDKFYK